MVNSNTPRHSYVDQHWAIQLMDYLRQARQELVRDIKSKQDEASQLDYILLAGYCRDLGLLQYAMGLPLPRVRDCFSEASQAYLKVFELRGSEDTFSAMAVSFVPESVDTEYPKVLERQPVHPPRAKDYSLTNSRTGLLAMHLALTLRNSSVAQRIADLVWDPPNASYVDPNSVVCTPNDQLLAYSLRDYLLGNDEAAMSSLRLIEIRETEIKHQTMMIWALVLRNQIMFLRELKSFLEWHQKNALNEENRKNPEFFLGLPGLGLCICALRANLVQLQVLPPNNAFLPIDLIVTNPENPINS